jgi:LEA14-like dessication related protein
MEYFMNRFKLFAAGLFLVYTLAGCGKPKAPQYVGYENFRLEEVGFSTNVLATDVKLYNPNSYALQLKSASMDVYFNDRFLGHSSLDSLIILPAKDTSAIPLRMKASARDLLSNTADLILNPTVKIRITGSAKAGRGGFFINVPINYEGTQRIQLFSRN